MIKINNIIIGSLFLLICLCSCGKKNKPIYFDTSYSEVVQDCDIIKVPYEENAGVKYIDIELYGLNFKMILDSGSSSNLISRAEFEYLLQKGYITEDNIIGIQKSQIADGSIVENIQINISEIIIGGKISCTDIIVSVSDNVTAPLLLGNEVLDRLASYTINNVEKVIEFKLK